MLSLIIEIEWDHTLDPVALALSLRAICGIGQSVSLKCHHLLSTYHAYPMTVMMNLDDQWQSRMLLVQWRCNISKESNLTLKKLLHYLGSLWLEFIKTLQRLQYSQSRRVFFFGFNDSDSKGERRDKKNFHTQSVKNMWGIVVPEEGRVGGSSTKEAISIETSNLPYRLVPLSLFSS